MMPGQDWISSETTSAHPSSKGGAMIGPFSVSFIGSSASEVDGQAVRRWVGHVSSARASCRDPRGRFWALLDAEAPPFCYHNRRILRLQARPQDPERSVFFVIGEKDIAPEVEPRLRSDA